MKSRAMLLRKRILKITILPFLLVLIAFFLALKGYTQAKKVEIKENSSGGYTLYVDQKPFLVKGVIYNPTPIGKGPGYNFFTHRPKPWMVTDGELMSNLGINAVRVYSAGDDLDAAKEFIRDLYDNYKIYTAVSDWLGLWDNPRANYADPEFRSATKERILKMVRFLKDEPGLLAWILGNENNYTFSGKIGFWTSSEIEKIEKIYQRQNKRAEIYYSFIEELAAEIKKIDPNHPVMLGNGETSFLNVAAETCNSVDSLAIIAYRGRTFTNLFENVRRVFDKPVLLSEFGCDSYDAYRKKENQEVQAEFILSQWKDIFSNTTLSGNKSGNALGGFLFEWTDEWWKHNEGYPEGWSKHDSQAGWSDGSYYYDIRAKHGLNMNEEWFGLLSLQNEKKDGINKRVPKESCHKLKQYFRKIEIRSVSPAEK